MKELDDVVADLRQQSEVEDKWAWLITGLSWWVYELQVKHKFLLRGNQMIQLH